MKRLICLPISMALLGAACSGQNPAEPATEPLNSTITEAEPVTAGSVQPMPMAADPTAAVVRVVTTGTFVSPDFGQMDTVAGSGSAFIIDETGLAVTNNHVVAGAASVEVFFDGTNEPVAATVVAKSECSDLAVIDLAGDGYPTLGWTDDETDVGLGIRAAGYPDGDPGLTLTGGIIARIENDGATPWASISSLLRHDAELAPGNSGGPIIDEAGKIVGVNVAASDSGRFAIPATVAQPIVESLRSGIDVDSIGLNAVAVLDEVTNESGVWVVSVEAGSPAAVAGVQAGDVITRMKGVRVGRDATLADYCSVVRSAGEGELPIEVTRDNEFFAGSVRGTAAMSRVLDVTDDMVDTASTPPATVSQPPRPGTPYEAFETVTDDTGTISIDVPAAWTDRRTFPVFISGKDRPAINASYDYEALEASIDTRNGGIYDQAGVAATVFSSDIDVADAFRIVMDNNPWMYDCTPLESVPFEDDVFEGAMQPFMDCAGTSSTVFSIGIKRIGEPGWLLINIFAPTVADLEAAVRIASSFSVEAPFVPEEAADSPEDGEGTDDSEDAEDEVEVVPGTAPTTTEPVDTAPDTELPDTLATADDVVTAIGVPPLAGTPIESDESGVAVTQYPTTASEDDLRTWIDERIAAVGCADPEPLDHEVDGLRYTITCTETDRGALIVFGVSIMEWGDGLRVVVTVIDLIDES